jgi:hypothetical protein
MKITEMLMVMKASSKEVTNVKWAHNTSFLGRRTFLCWQFVYLTLLTSEKLYVGLCSFKCVCVRARECW